MNRRTLRATGIVLTGMLLAGDPVSMIYAAPVAGVSVATTAEAVAVGINSAAYFFIVGALTLFSLVVMPVATSAALRFASD